MRAAVIAFVIAALPGCVRPTNPFDPESSVQAPATLVGRVQAVLGPIDPATGEPCASDAPPVCTPGDASTGCCVPEASFCDPVVGDHTGFQLILRSLDDDAAGDAIRAASAATNAGGEFAFINVPPGNYSLEVTRPGFIVPPPRALELPIGDTRTLGDLCALNATPPATPVLAPLPPALRARAGLTLPDIVIVGCAPGLRYRVSQRLGDVSDVTVIDGATATNGLCALPARVAPTGTTQAWSVSVVAEDALRNVSAAATADVVIDADAPDVPCDVTLSAGADRVLVTWGAVVGVDDDGDGVADRSACQREVFDDEARFIVSYGLSERPLALCPGGIDGDAFDLANLAVEGRSPIATTTPAQTLSGLLPGTELFVQVAALDAVGNPSCWSPPARVRPDVVTPEILAAVGAAPAGVVRQSEHLGVAAFARGAGGLSVRGADGALVDRGSVALDVVVTDEAIYSAAGALGLVRFALNGAAVATTSTTVAPGPARSVARVAGGYVIGTDTGVATVSVRADGTGSQSAGVDPGGLVSPVVRLAHSGGLVALAREVGVVQVVSLADPATVLGSLSALPRSMVIAGDTLWLAADSVVEVVDVGACPAPGCLGAPLRFALPAGLDAKDVAAWDDLVIVLGSPRAGSADPGGVLIYDASGRAPRLVGRAFAPAGARDLRALRSVPAGFCVTGTFDDVASERCFSTVRLPVAAAQVALTGASVTQTVLSGASAFALSRVGDDAVVSRFDVASGAERARLSSDGNELLAMAVVPGVGAYTFDDEGRLGFVSERVDGGGAVALIDDTAVIAGLTTALEAQGGVTARPLRSAVLAVADDDLIVAAHATNAAAGACRAVVIARVDLTTTAAGPAVADVDVATLAPAALRLSGIDVALGEVRLAVEPFAVLAVDSRTLAARAGGLTPSEACSAQTTTRVRAFGRTGAGRGALLASGVRLVGGVGLDALFDVSGDTAPVILSDASSSLSLFTRLGDFLAVGTASSFVIVDADGETDTVRPVMQVPGLAAVTSVQSTGRGLLIGGGASGAIFMPLR